MSTSVIKEQKEDLPRLCSEDETEGKGKAKYGERTAAKKRN